MARDDDKLKDEILQSILAAGRKGTVPAGGGDADKLPGEVFQSILEAGRKADMLRAGVVDKRAVQEWLAKQKPLVCPVSGDREWVIANEYVLPLRYPYEVPGRVASYPMVMVICGACGYTLHFNAVVMGLVPPGDAT